MWFPQWHQKIIHSSSYTIIIISQRNDSKHRIYSTDENTKLSNHAVTIAMKGNF